MSDIERVDVTELLSADDVSRTIARIAHQIIEKTALDAHGAGKVVLLGIPSAGVPLARRLADRISEFKTPPGSAADAHPGLWSGWYHGRVGR